MSLKSCSSFLLFVRTLPPLCVTVDRVGAVPPVLVMEPLFILETVVRIEVVAALSYAPLVSVNTINNGPRIWPVNKENYS